MADLQLDGSSIVLLGSFNPRIFQPFWFAMQGLIRPEEAEKAELKLVHPQITAFDIADFAQLQVSHDRFAVTTLKEPVLLRDLVLGVFQVLEHTPVRAMGINRDLHFALNSQEDWHALGDHLAPKMVWRELFAAEPRPGLKTLVIEGKRPGSNALYTRVKVEPSTRVPFGAYVHVNEHHQSEDDRGDLVGLMEVLRTTWVEAQQYALAVAERVVREGR
jgi:hypothetical protein